MFNVNFYDEKGRVIQTQSTNLTGGTDIGLTQYSWTGQPVLSIASHEKAGPNLQEGLSITRLTYDDLGRLVKIEKKTGHSKVN